MTTCESSPASKSYGENFAMFQPTPFIFLFRTAILVLFQGNWDPRDKTTPDKNAGLNIGASRRSKELHQDAILMTSSYRQNCLWPSQLMASSFMKSHRGTVGSSSNRAINNKKEIEGPPFFL